MNPFEAASLMKKPGTEIQIIGLQCYKKYILAIDISSCILLEQINQVIGFHKPNVWKVPVEEWHF